MEMKLSFKHLAACRHAITESETRYYLRGIHLEPTKDGLRYTATNGDIMVQVTDILDDMSNPIKEPFILPVEVIDRVLKAYRAVKKKSFVTLILHSDAIELVDYDNKQMFTFQKIDATFPDVERIKPRKADNDIGVQIVGMRAKDIALLSKAAVDFSGNEKIALKLRYKDATSIVECLLNYPGFYACFMPVRV